ncbi:MAG: radical SAM protein [Candidatus Edwardsbacteria bacterium]|nr:radical SAM protein [Candidatus Edwardsbacteria bacterium]MBU1576055.1 radical SAM protein [Candidatus Edwardsbacteria bacterium]MBU2462734.1 radical SAM protein [Candidatus Edwardsbacteria bacterium]MBU2594125.1 radical SAM protein [Candidatus Edwardsbacteria bacterium]
MRIIGKNGRKELASVYLAEMRSDPSLMVEFVDSCEPAVGCRDKKWVIVVSSQFGCPVGCLMCDAGGNFKGNLTISEIIAQIEHVILENKDLDPQKCPKLKVQFARMGEPALNDAVIDALYWLAEKYPKAMPCIATVAPAGREKWFESLLNVSRKFDDFQLQFSLNTTDPTLRDKLIPYPKMSWQWMSDYGQRFYQPGRRKPSLNFALSPGLPCDAESIVKYFDPEYFAIKLTPLNPTATAGENSLQCIKDHEKAQRLVTEKAREFVSLGYQVIESVGNMEENEIGSNCGQMVRRYAGKPAEYEKAPA